jgi:hypothetical protein
MGFLSNEIDSEGIRPSDFGREVNPLDPNDVAEYMGWRERAKANVRNQELSDTRTQRDKDMADGRKRGEELFGNGSLGRVDAARSAEVADLLARRQKEANGFSPEEMTAYRENNLNNTAQQLAGQMRQMRMQQAQNGVYGATAAAQQNRQLYNTNKDMINNERQLFLNDVDARRAGLSSYEQSLGAARNDELNRQMYNQGQVNKEKLGQAATEFGYGSLGTADRGALFQKWAAEDNASATRQSANNVSSGPCCFIFLEARYGNGSMDSVVRKFRDEHMTEQNKRGYYKLSEVLVPFMRKSKLIKLATRVLMTDPLVAYGKAYYGTGTKLGFVFTPVKNFWLRMFNYLGGNHPFIRENGEVI